MIPVNSPGLKEDDTPMMMYFQETMISSRGKKIDTLQDSLAKMRITKIKPITTTKQKVKGHVIIQARILILLIGQEVGLMLCYK